MGPDEPGGKLENYSSPEDPSSVLPSRLAQPQAGVYADGSNEDAGLQLNVIQGLETLPLLPVPEILAEPEIALLQIPPMKLPRTAVAPWLLASADSAQWLPYPFQPYLLT